MRNATIGLVFAVGCMGGLSQTTLAQNLSDNSLFDLAGWTKVAEGVYEQVDENGNLTRRSFGAAGAVFDRAFLETELSAVYERIDSGKGTDSDEDLIASRQEVLALMPEARGDFDLFDSTTGLVCNKWGYALDNHFVVGKAGATAVARSAFSSRQPGPVIALSSAYVYAEAVIEPASGPTVVASQGASLTGAIPVAVAAQWKVPGLPIAGLVVVTPSSCTASTFASVTASSPSCTGSNYASQYRTYATCVSAL